MGAMKAVIIPDYDKSCLIFIVHTLNKQTYNELHPENVRCDVIGAKCGMMVQDTILCIAAHIVMFLPRCRGTLTMALCQLHFSPFFCFC